MAYVVPTAADIKAAYTEFAAVGDDVIGPHIVTATRQVSTLWTEPDYTLGIMLYTAHLLSLGGKGASIATQLAGFQRLKLGPLDITLASPPAGTQTGSLESTIYGVQFEALAMANSGGGPILL